MRRGQRAARYGASWLGSLTHMGGTEVASGRDYLLGTGAWEYLQTGVRVAQNGTIEVMAGTTGMGEAVYFDNLRVEQTGGLIVQEQHQYAFGAPLPGLSYVVGTKRYRYGYQGQYAEHDEETGFESFQLRLYNSRVGRWMSYDPKGQFESPYVGMGNNPVSAVDPDGGFSLGPGPRYLTGTRLNSFGGSFLGSTAKSGLSAGARMGLQAGASALRVAARYNLDNKLPVKSPVHDSFVQNITQRTGLIKKYDPAFLPGGDRYAGDGIEPSYIFEDIIIGGIVLKPIWAALGPFIWVWQIDRMGRGEICRRGSKDYQCHREFNSKAGV